MEATLAMKENLLIIEATRWLGIQEVGGNNQGQLVQYFLQSCGLGPGNPWCMAFVQACIQSVDREINAIDPFSPRSQMAKGAFCSGVWGSTAPSLRGLVPLVGSIVVWKHIASLSGHTGIVISVESGGKYQTIEGNTSPNHGVVREGDGVFKKTHSTQNSDATMVLLGFISPWGKS